MPVDFNNKQQSQPQPSSQAVPVASNPEVEPQTKAKPEKEAPMTIQEMLTLGLSQADKDKVMLLHGQLTSGDFLVNFMFDVNTTIDIDINRHLKASLRIISTAEREDYDAYLYGKDPLNLYNDKDTAEIKAIAASENVSELQARELFLRVFPKDIAQARYSRVVLAASLLRLQGKAIGKTVKERFEEIGKLPVYISQQISGNLGLLERAIKIALSDDAIIKN